MMTMDDVLDEIELMDCDGCGETNATIPFTNNSVYFRCQACGLTYVATKASNN